jgi:hypothetical protein
MAGRTVMRKIPDLGAAVLFLSMGALMVGLAVTGRGTYSPEFLRKFSQWGSEHLAAWAQSLSVVPDWVFSLGLVAVVAGLVVLARPRRSKPLQVPKMSGNAIPPVGILSGKQQQGD